MHPPIEPAGEVPEAKVVRPRRARDLSRAEYLRPRDIQEVFGISQATLHRLCTHPDESKRLKSAKVPGLKGRKGMRLIKRSDIENYIERFSAESAH